MRGNRREAGSCEQQTNEKVIHRNTIIIIIDARAVRWRARAAANDRENNRDRALSRTGARGIFDVERFGISPRDREIPVFESLSFCIFEFPSSRPQSVFFLGIEGVGILSFTARQEERSRVWEVLASESLSF